MHVSRTLIAAFAFAASALPGFGGAAGDTSFDAEVQKYLARFDSTYRLLATELEEARWAEASSTIPRDAAASKRRIAAEMALAGFAGSVENIGLSRTYLQREKELSPVSRRELRRIEYLAARAPATVPDLVGQRIEEDVEAADALREFAYTLAGQPVTVEAIARVLRESSDSAARRAAWDALQEAGRAQRPRLVRLRWLRNECVRALGQRDYFAYRASEYGISAVELAKRAEDIRRDLEPLRRELHTWARYELARRFALPVPDLIPAHWLPDPSGRDWSGILRTSDAAIDAELAHDSPRAFVERAERFHVSLGFEALPPEFWERSWLGTAGTGAGLDLGDEPAVRHVDLDRDVRVRLFLDPNERGLGTALQALGIVHCKYACATPGVPFVLRVGANRALESAIGSLMEHAAEQPRCLRSLGLPARAADASMPALLSEALQYVEMVAWSAGTLLRFERELYGGDLPPGQWNARWWQLAAECQGIAAPAPRDERWCDAASTPEIVAESGDGYDRAFACVLMFQLHDHIARKILDADPHDTDYFGHREVGDFVRSIVRFGATVDWRAKLREKTGFDMSTRPMVEYFEPLRAWLSEQNRGRRCTLAPVRSQK